VRDHYGSDVLKEHIWKRVWILQPAKGARIRDFRKN
jgi:hypothetical protein